MLFYAVRKKNIPNSFFILCIIYSVQIYAQITKRSELMEISDNEFLGKVLSRADEEEKKD